MTEVRRTAATPEFSYQQLAEGEPVMCAPGLHVAFQRESGIQHSLRLTGGHSAAAGAILRPGQLVVSVAPANAVGPGDPVCLLNPVYQELVRHELPVERGPGLCLLLTGAAHKHHFSAVFLLQSDQAMPPRIVLDVDVADRCRTPEETLAATYLVHHDEQEPLLAEPGSHRIAWRGGRLGQGMLELLARPPSVITTPQQCRSFTSVRVEARTDPRTFTHRLHYSWRWTSDADDTQ
jgi:hypothetical protein